MDNVCVLAESVTQVLLVATLCNVESVVEGFWVVGGVYDLHFDVCSESELSAGVVDDTVTNLEGNFEIWKGICEYGNCLRRKGKERSLGST